LSGTCLSLVALLLPETARSVVGDGSGNVSGLRRTILSYLKVSTLSPFRNESNESSIEPVVLTEDDTGRRWRLPNPLESLKLLWAKDTVLITLIFGIFYMNLSSLQASTATLFIEVHHISGLQLGLVYLPSGIGSCIGAYGAGIVVLTLSLGKSPFPMSSLVLFHSDLFKSLPDRHDNMLISLPEKAAC